MGVEHNEAMSRAISRSCNFTSIISLFVPFFFMEQPSFLQIVNGSFFHQFLKSFIFFQILNQYALKLMNDSPHHKNEPLENYPKSSVAKEKRTKENRREGESRMIPLEKKKMKGWRKKVTEKAKDKKRKLEIALNLIPQHVMSFFY